MPALPMLTLSLWVWSSSSKSLHAKELASSSPPPERDGGRTDVLRIPFWRGLNDVSRYAASTYVIQSRSNLARFGFISIRLVTEPARFAIKLAHSWGDSLRAIRLRFRQRGVCNLGEIPAIEIGRASCRERV